MDRKSNKLRKFREIKEKFNNLPLHSTIVWKTIIQKNLFIDRQIKILNQLEN